MEPNELNETLNQISAQLTRVSDDLSSKAEAALKEAKNSGDATASIKVEVDKLLTEQSVLTENLKAANAKLEEFERRGVRSGEEEKASLSFGAQVIASAEIKDLTAANLQMGRQYSAPVANALYGKDLADGVVEPTRLPGIDKKPKQRLFIRDLIDQGRVGGNAIFWVQQTGFNNQAKVVAEGTQKPYSTISFETKMTPVVTIAHLFKASKQIMDDMPQLQSTIDAEMRYGLAYAEEQEILFGAGGTSNVEGIIPQAEEFAPAFAPDKRSKIDDIRLALLQAQVARLPATGIVMHHLDWAKIELTKDDVGGYIFANPLSLASANLWGLPVVATETAEFDDKFLLGAFDSAAMWFGREDANVVIATTNADDFEKNMITVRCEERGALAVKRPEAFVFGQFGAAAAG